MGSKVSLVKLLSWAEGRQRARRRSPAEGRPGTEAEERLRMMTTQQRDRS